MIIKRMNISFLYFQGMNMSNKIQQPGKRTTKKKKIKHIKNNNQQKKKSRKERKGKERKVTGHNRNYGAGPYKS